MPVDNKENLDKNIGVSAEIQTEHLPNRSIEVLLLDQPIQCHHGHTPGGDGLAYVTWEVTYLQEPNGGTPHSRLGMR